jgi:hypothetical protein
MLKAAIGFGLGIFLQPKPISCLFADIWKNGEANSPDRLGM